MARPLKQILARIVIASKRAPASVVKQALKETPDPRTFVTALQERGVLKATDIKDLFLDGERLAALARKGVIAEEDVILVARSVLELTPFAGEEDATLAQPVDRRAMEIVTKAIPAPSPTEFFSKPMEILDDLLKRTGRYDLVGSLGRGGMAEVYEVHDREIGRIVALKVIRQEALENSEEWILRHFLEEARTAGQLEHPNIMPIYTMGRLDDGRFYFTMKRIQGESLEEILDGPWPSGARPGLDRLLDLFGRICDAVAFAGARGVVHRDLKPSNVMVGEFGEVLVLDWGIAKIVGDTRSIEDSSPVIPRTSSAGDTMAGEAIGTPKYMSPEQASGRLDDIDHRTDVFALGAILYHMLAHSPPFLGNDPRKIMKRIVEKDVVPPHRRAPGKKIPRELSSITVKALARDQRARYQTASNLGEEIHRFRNNERVHAHVDSVPVRVIKGLKRHPVLSAAGLSGLFIGVLSVVTFMLSSHYQQVEAENRLAWELEAQEEAHRIAEEQEVRFLIESAEVAQKEGSQIVARVEKELIYPLGIEKDDWDALSSERLPRIADEDVRRLESFLEQAASLSRRTLDRKPDEKNALKLLVWAKYHRALLEIYLARRKRHWGAYPSASAHLQELGSLAGSRGKMADQIRTLQRWLDGKLRVSVWVRPGGGEGGGVEDPRARLAAGVPRRGGGDRADRRFHDVPGSPEPARSRRRDGIARGDA